MGAFLNGQPESACSRGIDDDPNKNGVFIAFRPERNSGMDSADLLNPTAFVVLEDEVRFGSRAAATVLTVGVRFALESGHGTR
jgi:hypothetical protein